MGARLAGQTVLVTGAARGLGKAFCETIAREGGTVLALGRNADSLAAMLADLPGSGHDIVIADVTEPNSLTTVLSGRRFNGLVNNAGVAMTAPIHKGAVEDVRRVIDTNLLGSLWVLHASVPSMVAAGGGIAVNIASVLGNRPLPLTGVYAASKAAIIQMTRSAALELAHNQIRVNALAPGYVVTDLNREILSSEIGTKLLKRIPLSRFATPDELMPPLLLLLDPENTYMTGETLIVDGGMSAGL